MPIHDIDLAALKMIFISKGVKMIISIEAVVDLWSLLMKFKTVICIAGLLLFRFDFLVFADKII